MCPGLLLSTDGLVRWTNLKGVRPLVTWSPPAFHGLKWNVNGSSIGKPGPAGVEVFFVIIGVWCNVCDTTKRLMFSFKCKSIEVINNPARPGLNHKEANCINYK